MITIDQELCVGCGLCVRICHEQCITLSGHNGKKVDRIDHEICSTCTQCIAICSQQALSWDQVSAVPYDQAALPSASQLEELFKQRRTIREFRSRRINREVIEEILRTGIYSPTNNYHLRLIVVDEPSIIKTLAGIVTRFATLYYNLFYRSDLVFHLVRLITPEVNSKNRVKLKRGVENQGSGETPPAALVFIVGDRRILLSDASAQYALYNIILYSHAKGIGSRINASGPVVLDRSRTGRKIIGLSRQEHILGMVELGYPAVKFKNKVEGKRMSIQWNRGYENGS